MISYEFLEEINNQLTQYRDDGKSRIIFDTRDPSNYGDYEWDKTVEMMKAADPTGLSIAMLISAKIDATIACSKVELFRVLEEPGFFDELKEIHRIRQRLDDVLQGPLGAFMARVESLIMKVSPEFAKPTKLEIAVSLRDAIYCASQGMKLAWVQCDGEQPHSPVTLHSHVAVCETLAGFVERLKGDLPMGAHLASVDGGYTAIGFKKPGRIAYLSSMYIDVHKGQMRQHNSETYARDKLDLDGFERRYPDFSVFLGRGKGNEVAAEPQIKLLSRDRMIWLAMLVELTNQDIAKVTPSTIRLTESGKLAISHDSMVRSNLPVPYVPSWKLAMPTQADVFESLGFTEWERKYLGKLLEGVEEGAFMPVGDQKLALRFDTKKQVPVIAQGEAGYNYLHESELSENSTPLTSISESIAGTEEEVSGVVLRIYQRNMSTWLLKLGNIKFAAQWKEDQEWFRMRLAKNAEKALNHECASIIPEANSMGHVSVYQQSPKHSRFNPLCVFDKKSKADTIVLVNPRSARDIVAVLGLKNESMLPEHLQGWSREQGWTTSASSEVGTPCSLRWSFADRSQTRLRGYGSDYQGLVYIQRFNHPIGSRKA